MSIENGQVLSTIAAPIDGFWLVLKIGIITLAGIYFIFSLIITRQVNLMTEVVLTEATAYMRAFAIIHAGLALGIIILLVGFLFGW